MDLLGGDQSNSLFIYVFTVNALRMEAVWADLDKILRLDLAVRSLQRHAKWSSTRDFATIRDPYVKVRIKVDDSYMARRHVNQSL